MEFRVLGPLEASRDGARVPLGSAQKPRLLLAALLSRADRPVTFDALIAAIWEEAPPASARQNLRHYVHQLRGLLGDGCIASHPGGYILRAGDEVDAARFRRLAAEGTAALDGGDAAAARGRLRAALDLWRGPAYADFTDCAWLADEPARLEELRLTVYERWAQAELALGQHGAPVSELTDLVRAHPYRESLTGCLMRALHGSGRQADALRLFRDTRALLADQLGVEPGAALQRLHQQLLSGDQGDQRGEREPTPVPRELPADVSGFTGRTDVLEALDEMLATSGSGAPLIAAITGTAGVGKTALAVRWAHRVADRFPDGQLYLNLRGHAPGRPLRPIEALTTILTALGTPPEQVPVEVTAAAARYRSLVSGRRMLVVLDNAESAIQVRPLLAGSAGCLALITSRDRLTGLVAHDGARRVELSVLSAAESVELLGHVAGSGRVAAEPTATARLASTCANLPLALRIAGAGLADQPTRTIADYVAELTAGNPVADLAVDGDDDISVRYAFDLSYRALSEPARQMFRCLGLVPCPDFSTQAVAALTGATTAQARRTMDRLIAAHLVIRAGPDRFTTHDLLRQYTTHLALAEDSGPLRAAATRRLFDWLASMSIAAARVLFPELLRLPATERYPATMPGLTGADAAREWLDAERHNLIAAILHAARHGPHQGAWLCADAMRAYHDQGRHLTDWLTTSRAALAAARADGDLHAQAASFLGLAHAHYSLSHYRRSVTYLRRALALAGEAGWDQAEATISANLAIALQLQGHTTECIDYLHQALAIHEKIDWPSGRARATSTLATVYQHIGRLREAAALATRAAEIYPKDAALGQAHAGSTLGEIYALLGRLHEAGQLLDAALVTYRAFGSRRSEANCQVWRARLHRYAGRPGRSEEAAVAALMLADETGIPELQAAAYHALGLVRDMRGDHRGALRELATAFAIACGIDTPHTACETLLGLAKAHHHVGDHAAAVYHAGKALALAQRAGFAVLEGCAQTLLGQVHHHLGEHTRALAHARRALRAHRATGHRIGAAETHLLLAAILHGPAGDGHHRRACSLYRRIGGSTTTWRYTPAVPAL